MFDIARLAAGCADVAQLTVGYDRSRAAGGGLWLADNTRRVSHGWQRAPTLRVRLQTPRRIGCCMRGGGYRKVPKLMPETSVGCAPSRPAVLVRTSKKGRTSS